MGHLETRVRLLISLKEIARGVIVARAFRSKVALAGNVGGWSGGRGSNRGCEKGQRTETRQREGKYRTGHSSQFHSSSLLGVRRGCGVRGKNNSHLSR